MIIIEHNLLPSSETILFSAVKAPMKLLRGGEKRQGLFSMCLCVGLQGLSLQKILKSSVYAYAYSESERTTKQRIAEAALPGDENLCNVLSSHDLRVGTVYLTMVATSPWPMHFSKVNITDGMPGMRSTGLKVFHCEGKMSASIY